MTREPGPITLRIREKLISAFSPTRLEIDDQSHLHAGHGHIGHAHEGHAGGRTGGETHFKIEIVSPAFAGRSRVDIQRNIFDVLSEELSGQVHALSIKASDSVK